MATPIEPAQLEAYIELPPWVCDEALARAKALWKALSSFFFPPFQIASSFPSSFPVQLSIVPDIELNSVGPHFPGSIGCSHGGWDSHCQLIIPLATELVVANQNVIDSLEIGKSPSW
jgi:hypothetical protein